MSVHASLAHPSEVDEPTCTLWYIQNRLGRSDYGERRMVTYVTLLIREHDFPPPLPTLRRGILTRDVVARSRWIRTAVDAWLEDFLPPANAEALDKAARRAAADDMDEAARNLGRLTLVQGGRA